MGRDYIPRPNAKYNEFQSNLAKKVVANAVAWKIPAEEVDAFQQASVKYGNLFRAISNKATRTKTQVQDHDEFRKTFEIDLRAFVNSYIRSNKNISPSEVAAMGIKRREKKRKHRAKIDTTPVLFIESKGGLRLRFVCRIESHYGKGSIHSESDGLEIRYIIGTKTFNAKEAKEIHFSKKAHFILEFAEEDRGKYIYVFARWKNQVNQSLSGPWCEVVIGFVF